MSDAGVFEKGSLDRAVDIDDDQDGDGDGVGGGGDYNVDTDASVEVDDPRVPCCSWYCCLVWISGRVSILIGNLCVCVANGRWICRLLLTSGMGTIARFHLNAHPMCGEAYKAL